MDSKQIKQALSNVSAAYGTNEDRNTYFAKQLSSVQSEIEKVREKSNKGITSGIITGSAANIGTVSLAVAGMGSAAVASGGIAAAGIGAAAAVKVYKEVKLSSLKEKENSAQNSLDNSSRDERVEKIVADTKGSPFKQIVDAARDKALGHDKKAIEVNEELRRAVFLKDNDKIADIVNTSLNREKNPQFVDYLARKGNDENSPAKAVLGTLKEHGETVAFYEKLDLQAKPKSNEATQEKVTDKTQQTVNEKPTQGVDEKPLNNSSNIENAAIVAQVLNKEKQIDLKENQLKNNENIYTNTIEPAKVVEETKNISNDIDLKGAQLKPTTQTEGLANTIAPAKTVENVKDHVADTVLDEKYIVEEIDDSHYENTIKPSPEALKKQEAKNSDDEKLPDTPKVDEPQSDKEAELLKKEYLLAKVSQSFENDGKTFLHKESKKLAFVDRGEALKTSDNSSKVVHAMTTLAEAKGWKSIEVTGDEKFRRQVWLEANEKGIEVKGYKPNEKDLAELRGRMADKAKATIEKPKEPLKPVTAEVKAVEHKKVIEKLTISIKETGYPKGATNDNMALMMLAAEHAKNNMPNINDRKEFISLVSEKTGIQVATKDDLKSPEPAQDLVKTDARI